MKADLPILALIATASLGLPTLAQEGTADATAPVIQEAATDATALPKSASRIPVALRVLVPDNSVAFGLTHSLSDLEKVVSGIASEIAPDAVGMVDLDVLFSLVLPVGADSVAIDRTKPIGLALGPISGQSEPQAFLLIPTENPDAIKALLPTEGEFYSTRVSGGYLGITRGLEYPESTGKSALFETVPEGLVGISIDAEAIMKSLGPLVELGFQLARMGVSDILAEDPEAAEGLDLPTIMDSYFGLARNMLDSMKTLNLSLSIDETLVDLRWQIVTFEDSPMSSLAGDAPTSVSKFMPLLADDSLAFVFGADSKDLMGKTRGFFEALFAAYPEPLASSFIQSLDSWDDMYGLFADAVAASGGFGDSGLRLAAHFDGAEFDTLLTKYGEIVHEPFWHDMGLHYVDTKVASPNGTTLTRFTFDFDFSTLLDEMGPGASKQEMIEVQAIIETIYGSQMIITFAKAGDIGVMTLGGDDAYLQDAIARATQPTRLSFDMAHLTDLAATSNPFIAYRLDLGQALTQMVPLLEQSLGMPATGFERFEGTSLPLNLYTGITKTAWTGGLLIDLLQANEFVQMVQAAEEM